MRCNFSENGALCTNCIVHKLDCIVTVSCKNKPTICSKGARVGKISINWSKTLNNFSEDTEITVRVD